MYQHIESFHKGNHSLQKSDGVPLQMRPIEKSLSFNVPTWASVKEGQEELYSLVVRALQLTGALCQLQSQLRKK